MLDISGHSKIDILKKHADMYGILLIVLVGIYCLCKSWDQGCPEDGGAQGKYKSGALQYGLCEGVWGHAPRKFEILHALKES